MSTFGDRLRHERESRDARIQDVSDRTRINPRYLEALEANDFEALPGPRGFGKLYIRAYAEMLGFDAQPLIEAFDQEQDQRRRAELKRPASRPTRALRTTHAVADVSTEAPAEPASVEAASVKPAGAREPARSRGGWIVVAALAGVALLILAGVALIPKSPPPAPEIVASSPAAAAIRAESAGTPEVAVGERIDTEPEVPAITERAVAPVQEPEVAAVAAETLPGLLDVTEFAIGEGVVDRRIVGPGTRFKEGTPVAFLTRVVGGTSGQKVRHVWLREGRVVQSIELSLGGSHWRTHSTKTLWGQGNWSVEARDVDGDALARADFFCEAP